LASTRRRASSARKSSRPWARSHLIPSSVVRAFHARPRKNFEKYKDYDEALLEQLMGKLPIRPPIWTKLRPHQKISFLIGAALGRFAFFLDTGMGKTLLAIALQRYFRKLKKLNGFCLVLVPNRSNKAEWKREIKKHSPKTRSLVLRGSSINKWEQLANAVDPHIVIETYAGLSRMLTKSMEIKKGRRKGKMRLQFDRAKVKRLRTMIAMLVMDESTLVKNKRSLAFRFCDHLSKHIKFVFGMTGTPFGADIEDLQPQMLIIDRGYTLGATLALFRAAFFDQKEGGFTVEYTFDKKKEKLLHQYLAHSSITFEADEADLPQLVPVLEYVTLPKDAAALYEDAKQKLIAAHGNYQEQKNAFVRLRQLSSGWLGYKDDETGKRAQFEFKPNPKLDMLLAKIQEVPRNKKIIVFHDYIYTGAMIARELKKRGRRLRSQSADRAIRDVLRGPDQHDHGQANREALPSSIQPAQNCLQVRLRLPRHVRPTDPRQSCSGQEDFRRDYPRSSWPPAAAFVSPRSQGRVTCSPVRRVNTINKALNGPEPRLQALGPLQMGSCWGYKRAPGGLPVATCDP
jgi:superfamily II DNA or RNA helicase